ncbi:MAG: enoyl-CoA hydratase/isomerase family protein [Deltaproteobacteria bacterium]|nr:enoyl-CoA hydratase/isomerase family protein [Deltaproteobacteria bacterium]
MSVVEYEKSGHLVTITMNRPEKLNAIDPEMLLGLREAWRRYQDDEDAWVAILTGAGRAFSAGADKSWFARALQGEDSVGIFLAETLKDPYWSGRLDKPTVAAVQGYAVGGALDLVLRADFRVAGESATFQLPEVERGNVIILWDNLPYAIAAELLAGFPFTAQRAYQVGVLNRLAPDAGVMDAARELAEGLLSRPPLPLHHGLRILRDIKNGGTTISRNLLNHFTTSLSKDLARTEDYKEAVAALLEKRKPTFRRK